MDAQFLQDMKWYNPSSNVYIKLTTNLKYKCKSWCNICRAQCNIQQEVICTACSRKCRSQDCLKAHQEERKKDRVQIKVKYYLHIANKLAI